MSHGAYLELTGLTKRFGEHVAVDRVSLSLARGQSLALLGPSGSGKTTTLRLLGGFERPDAGRILVDGEDVTGTPPAARRFGMVFQHYALFPHLDVRGNVGFGLESLGVGGAELDRRIREALALVELDGMERRRVTELSGGQQQRVALARALAPEPRVLLLDEPLSNLDPTLRERTRRELRGVIERVGITTVIVTHEQEEAFDLGTLVAVLNHGRVEQVATPDELYDHPATLFVAGFVGRASRLRGVLEAGPDGGHLRLDGVRWPVGRLPAAAPANGPVVAMVRPEAVRIVAADPGRLRGRVLSRRFTGSQGFFTVDTPAGLLEVSAAPRAAQVGELVGLEPAGPGVHLYPEQG